MKKLTTILGLITALLLIATPGFAQSQADKGKDRKAEALKKYDANGDGQLDATEKAAAKEGRKAQQGKRKEDALKKYDSDGDGQLSESERAAAKEARGASGGRQGGKRGK
jgi:hypothetical protein